MTTWLRKQVTEKLLCWDPVVMKRSDKNIFCNPGKEGNDGNIFSNHMVLRRGERCFCDNLPGIFYMVYS
jgi:hypothetical protein